MDSMRFRRSAWPVVAMLSAMFLCTAPLGCSDDTSDSDSDTTTSSSTTDSTTGGSTSNSSGGGDEGGGGSGSTSTASGGDGGGGSSTTSSGGGGEGGGGSTSTSSSSGGAGGEGGSTSSSSGGGGEGGEGGGGGSPPVDLNCSGWTRDASFDALKIDGNDIEHVGGIAGSSANDIYVSIATFGKGAIAHWNGSWTYEALPSTPFVPQAMGGIWMAPNGTVYATGKDINASRLFVRTGGVWTNAANEPSTIEMVDVTGVSNNDVWILGQDAGFGRIWRKNGANWSEQSLPASLPFPQRMMRIWALDANNVFATGYTLDVNSDPDGGFLIHFDGTDWEEIFLPADNRQINAIHGTSINDLFITGQKVSGQGVVYRFTNGMGFVEEYADPQVDLYYPVWSKSPGAVLAGGVVPPGTSGSMRTTVDSMMSSPTTDAVDAIATNPAQFWPAPGTDQVHFVHGFAPGVVAGHYVGICN
jgi:hypothetical protein